MVSVRVSHGASFLAALVVPDCLGSWAQPHPFQDRKQDGVGAVGVAVGVARLPAAIPPSPAEPRRPLRVGEEGASALAFSDLRRDAHFRGLAWPPESGSGGYAIQVVNNFRT